MNRIFSRLGLTAFAIVAASGTALVAQQSTGTIKGQVMTHDGAPMAGVTVRLVNQSTQLTLTHVTSSDGRFIFFALPVGRYMLTFTSGGHSYKQMVTAVLGQEMVASFKWPAEATAVVEVVAGSDTGIDTVDTSSAQVGVNVQASTIQALPVIDRNINSAAVLAPGVQIIQGSQVDPTKKTSTYIVSGEGQGRGTNFNVDGADNNSSDVGGYVLPVPMDAIDQFQVVTNQYKAEFGRSNAGFLNVVTRSGGNDFQGIVNAQWTNQNMRAARTDELPKLDNDTKTYSVEVSGPILKDRLFYMVAVERTDSTTGQSFDPRAIAIYSSLGNTPNALKKRNLYSKFTWNINQNWNAEFRYARYYDTSANQTFPHTDAVSGYVDPTMLGTNRDDTTMFGAKLTGIFGMAVWESNINHSDYTNSIRPSISGPNNGTFVEVRGPVYASSPTDYWRSGSDPNAWQNTGVKRNEWRNDVTFSLGDHTLKAGADLQKTDYPFEQYFWGAPTVYIMGVQGVPFGQEWSNTVSQLNVVRTMLTAPTQSAPTSFNGYGLYLQDDWALGSHWTISGGLRLDWDTQLDYYSRYDSLYQQIHATNPGLVGIGSQAPRTHHYGSPRLQVLYKPRGDDSLTFKMGYGRFVASTIDNVVGFSRALGSAVNGIPGGYIYNNAALAALGKKPSAAGVANFAAGTILGQANGNNIVLPADLTPYNYANNVNGLQNYFRNTVGGWLTPASFATGGRQLLASDFSYPTTQTLTLGVTYKFSDTSAIDMTAIYSKTKHNTVQYGTDGSQPFTNYGPGGAPAGDMGDYIFLSNQEARSAQLQTKYTYATSKSSFMATLVISEFKSTSGGDAGSFSNSQAADFYGGGAVVPWQTGPERLSGGTQALSGTFAWAYHTDFGTHMAVLGQWHSGKYYDTYLGYSPNPGYGPGASTDLGDPSPWVGTGQGDWNLSMDVKVSQDFHVAKVKISPYLMIQNILNNYDYGNNYQNSLFNSDGSYNTTFGTRGTRWQANNPRNAAIGVRCTW